MKKEAALKVYGIFGYPLKHTLSPNMHNRAFQEIGLKSFYLPFEFDRKDFLCLLRRHKDLILEGFNVTIPYKELVIKYLDRLSTEAQFIGAVNTVKKVGCKLIGYNTDAYGFWKSLKLARFRPKAKKVMIFGAGGAARALLYVLLREGVSKIVIVEVVMKRARKLRAYYLRKFPQAKILILPFKQKSKIKINLKDTDLLINASGVGLKKNEPVLLRKNDFRDCRGKIFAYDLIYKPALTQFLKTAQSSGCRILNGLDMLLYQGVGAFEIWTKKKAPISTMKKALLEGLKA